MSRARNDLHTKRRRARRQREWDGRVPMFVSRALVELTDGERRRRWIRERRRYAHVRRRACGFHLFGPCEPSCGTSRGRKRVRRWAVQSMNEQCRHIARLLELTSNPRFLWPEDSP